MASRVVSGSCGNYGCLLASKDKSTLVIMYTSLLVLSPYNCNYVHLTQESHWKQHERLTITCCVHIMSNFLLFTHLSHWNQALKDIFTN